MDRLIRATARVAGFGGTVSTDPLGRELNGASPFRRPPPNRRHLRGLRRLSPRHRATMLPRYLLRGSKYHWQERFRALIATVGPPVPNILSRSANAQKGKVRGGYDKTRSRCRPPRPPKRRPRLLAQRPGQLFSGHSGFT